MKSILFLMGKRGDWSKRGDWRSRSRWHSDDDWRSGYKGDDKPRYYKKRDDDEYVIIDFEGNNVPQDSTNSLQNILTFDPIYTEDGFELTAQQSPNSVVDPIGVDLADISFDNPFLPELNAAINRVSQSGGRVTGLAGESESDLVIRRAGGKDFEFEGGYFAFAPIIDIPGGLPAGAVPSTNTEASIKLVFEGYKNGFLVDSFESMIPANGYIKSKIDEDIDTLIIKDNDLHGWVVTDNLKFEI